ncbi:ATP-binding protein [Roseobacteraceae bacterium NS-SX3]
MSRRIAPLLPRWLIAAATLVLLLLALFSVRAGLEVLQRLENLSTAATDNVQWSLAQAEVEHLNLENAVLAAKGEEDLPHLRRQFDIFYNRMTIIRESALFQALHQSREGAALLAGLQDRLDSWAAVVDGSGEALTVQLPRLAQELAANGNDVRRLALLGMALQVEAAEDSRLQLLALLSRLTASVLALVLALALTALLLARLYRRGQQLAAESREAAARMEVMVASSLDAVLMVGADGRIQAFNGAAETIFGYSAGEAIGQNVADLIVPDHLRAAHERGMQRLLDTGEARLAGKGRAQMGARRKSGALFPAELAIAQCQSDGEQVFVGFLRDISDRVAAEEQLRRARDDALAGERAKANLLTVMSHEMRTPLTGILGSLDLLEGAGLTTEQAGYLDAMRASGELLLHHVDDVLELSRLESCAQTEPPRVFDLEEFLRDLTESQQAAAQARGNRLTLQCSISRSPGVAGRPRALGRALNNLVSNALKFTRDGSVSIDVHRVPGTDTVEFHVADTGQGIASEDIERIFEPFVRLDCSCGRGSEGTGLGLAITRRIVAGMGGSVTCESEPGEGSLFSIALPLPAAKLRAAPAEEETDAKAQDARAGRQILVTDDNAINRLLLEKMLGQLGHTVTTAAGGAEAVELVQNAGFDLIFMDISMPEVDGIEAVRRIRARGFAAKTPIVALTAHAAPEDHARFLKAGFAEVLTKPARKSALADVIARRVQGAGATVQDGGEADIPQFIELLGAEQARRFLAGFRDDVTRLRGELESAESLTSDQRQEAHRLAGSAAVLGLAELHSCMLDIEEANDSGPPPVQPLARAWEEAEEILVQYLSA